MMVEPHSLAAASLVLLLSSSTVGCKRARAQATEANQAAITSVEVPGDEKVLVADGNPSVRTPIVYLHGMCADPRDDLEAWGGLAQQLGTVVALVGDAPCPDRPGRTKWTTDAEAIDARIRAAVDAVSASRRVPLDKNEALLIGESMGAARAESVAAKFPDRYPRLVLVGSPQAPSPKNLADARAVANLAGEKESQEKMKEGTRVLEKAGIRTRFWELPGAAHGEYGPEGQRIMSEAVAFVAAQ